MNRLSPLPNTFAATRAGLHRVAEELVKPARKPQNEIALTQTPGGFGTPPFEYEGAQIQVRVDGTELVLERDGAERRAELESLAAGGELLGPELLPDGVPEDTSPLGLDLEAAAVLAEFYAFAADVLDGFRGSLSGDSEPSEAILWPEHFDIALEAGSESEGQRANYGASPGDDEHAEPYLYVGPWTAKPAGELWNATGFPGAELSYAELTASSEPSADALTFLETRFESLRGQTP